ncbi:M20/M25/M40 family metallo-hydrolase [Streptosporangium vulgare]|uniref:M20/M25/M40 family metallo-hydrolase n=1 Tax=Streptosporangium vulgare TaxID=46190 RepID=UPI0031DB9A08
MTIAKRPSHPELSNSVREAILASRTEWEESAIALSREIHRVPEIAFQERYASTLVARELEAAGFDVAIGAYGLDTAVEATYGSGDVTVAICAEYDALPGIGHACGHNIIGAAAVGAAIALTAVADRIGLRIKLLGTPAEEHGGGKVIMLDAGAWDDVTFSLMVHGAPGEDVRCLDVRTQAVCRLHIMFQGRPGHTGGPTPSSDNASNAATIGLVALGLLRQHLPDGVRANAFVSEGGQTTNVVPAAAAVRVEVRADTGLTELVRPFQTGNINAWSTAYPGCPGTPDRTNLAGPSRDRSGSPPHGVRYRRRTRSHHHPRRGHPIPGKPTGQSHDRPIVSSAPRESADPIRLRD